MAELPKELILGASLSEIGHSEYCEPEFIVEGIGPASFRSHYLRLSTGIVLDLFTAEITLSDVTCFAMSGEPEGISIDSLLGCRVTDLWCDDTSSSLVVLNKEIYLRDDNDGFYGNPLRAGYISNDYSEEEFSKFTDYWTGERACSS